jgi:hypothetical protein
LLGAERRKKGSRRPEHHGQSGARQESEALEAFLSLSHWLIQEEVFAGYLFCKFGTNEKELSMVTNVVQINRNGGQPEIELEFGFAQFAQYRIFLWDINGKNPILLGHGVNVDTVPDKFPINEPVANLDNRFITWQAVIASPTGIPGQQYSMKATFTQDGANCPDGPFSKQGALNPDPLIALDKAKIQLV